MPNSRLAAPAHFPATAYHDLCVKGDEKKHAHFRRALFADFRAVREGSVFSTDQYLYRATDIVGEMIASLKGMPAGETEGMTLLRKVS